MVEEAKREKQGASGYLLFKGRSYFLQLGATFYSFVHLPKVYSIMNPSKD
jgi:hypothetical protein